MGLYARSISKATGVTDPEVLRELEEIMRNEVFHSTLDWQTTSQFNKGAKEAKKIYDAWKAKGE